MPAAGESVPPQDAERLVEHVLAVSKRDMLDHVLAEHVVECVVLKWKRNRHIQADHIIQNGHVVGIEPAVDRVIAAAQVKFRRFLGGTMAIHWAIK